MKNGSGSMAGGACQAGGGQMRLEIPMRATGTSASVLPSNI